MRIPKRISLSFPHTISLRSIYFPFLLILSIFMFAIALSPTFTEKAYAGSCPTGGWYCGNDGLGLNANTLYYCTGAGANPQVSQNCSYGCKINPPGTPDSCNPAPSGPCPSGGDYCGGSVGQNSNNLYYCSGAGANPTLKQSCSNGCHVNPPGTPDVCNAPPSGPCPSGGDYCGGSVGQNSNNLYYCSGAGANPTLKQSCSNGCHVNPPGTPDVCNAPPSGPCPSAGDYCGGSVGQNSNNLYYCSGAGANPTLKQSCSNGCHVNPPGTPDVCNAAPSGLCPGAGKYCGVSVGENTNNVYSCTGAGANPTLFQACSNGCKVNPPGVADVCNAPALTTCPGTGDYCGSSVSLNPNNLYRCSGAGSTPQLKQSCSNGCQVNPSGTADVCKTAAQTTSCPNGNGLYCGGTVNRDPSKLYNCNNGSYYEVEVCNNGCQVNAPGTSDQCKTPQLASGQDVIFPMLTAGQNITDFKVEPGFIYGAGPIYLWPDCYGNKKRNDSLNVYHGGIDIIYADAKGTLEVDPNNASDVTACRKGSRGAIVVAISAGSVTYVNTGSDGTILTIKLDVTDLGRTVYATYEHINPATTFQVNDRVTMGQQIGTVGDFSSNPHLHFQITTSSNWGNGYASTANPEQDDNGFINPCAFFLRHGSAVPANCPNVSSNGAEIVSSDKDVKLVFPVNAVTEDVLVQLNRLSGNYVSPLGSNLVLGGNAYNFSAYNVSGQEISNFDQEVLLEIKYNQDLLDGMDINKVDIYYFNTVLNKWVKAAGSKIIDQVKQTIKVSISHFSEYAVLYENTPPAFTQIPSQTITQGETFSTIDLSTYGTDTDGDALTWSYTGNTNISVSISGNIATLTYPANWTGSENIIFTVTDTDGLAANSTATFTVNAVSSNSVELLSSAWHLVGNNGASEKYEGIGDVPLAGKTALRITYDLHGLNALGGDASAIIFDQNGWRFVSLADYGVNGMNGVQTVDIPLSDFENLDLSEGSDTIHTRFWYWGQFTVDIYSIQLIGVTGTNNPPLITSTPISSANEGSSYSYDVNASDVENTALVYSLTSKPAGMVINSSTGVISWNPDYNSAGTHPVTVSVTDGVNTVTQSYNLVVNNVNRAPVVDQIPGQSKAVGQAFSTINLADYGNDPDGNTITWSYSGNTSISVVIANNVATLTPASNWTGTESITFKATDSGGLFSTSTASFTVSAATVGTELLTSPWHLVGDDGASEEYQTISSSALAGKSTLRITYNLNGLNALGGDASAIIFDQNGWQYVSLSDYGVNGMDGVQTVDIPLSDFEGLNLTQGSTTIHTRFWYWSEFTVDITSIKVF